MGKYERGDAEKVERRVVSLLRGEMVEEDDLTRIARSIYEKVREDYPDVSGAEHIGNRYAEPGDVRLTLNDGAHAFLEIKVVSSGKGTRANLGQDSLTEWGLFEEGTLSWSAFRGTRGHQERVLQILESYGSYPSRCDGSTSQRLVCMASQLKELVGPLPGESVEKAARRLHGGAQRAAEVVNEVVEFDREVKLQYLSYLRGRRQVPENVRKFTVAILAGYHSRRAMGIAWRNFDQLIGALRNYRVYYAYKGTEKVVSENLSEKVLDLLGREMRVLFRDGETNVALGFVDRGREVPVLRVVLHWKNLFQGIKTPCLNVFDEEFLLTQERL
ncbi:hypothetical protein [Sulfodiicoccus acidiphilus]|uniref:hypothetical protein n=1 Tax=Sulfodiicoccus acidiphilus TaxID=1670455 RepID=UPI000F81950D|nr:hypothetical protein [Sulfodiicoccus acidiphilus]